MMDDIPQQNEGFVYFIIQDTLKSAVCHVRHQIKNSAHRSVKLKVQK